jgi:hypothetical protein
MRTTLPGFRGGADNKFQDGPLGIKVKALFPVVLRAGGAFYFGRLNRNALPFDIKNVRR